MVYFRSSRIEYVERGAVLLSLFYLTTDFFNFIIYLIILIQEKALGDIMDLKALVSQMTIKEKLGQLGQYNASVFCASDAKITGPVTKYEFE